VEATKSCGVAAGFCDIDQECWNNGAADPANPCLACNASQPSIWSPAPAGTACNTGDACHIDGMCTAAGQCGGVPRQPPAPLVRAPMSGTRTGSVWAPSAFAVRRPLLGWSEPPDGCTDPVTYDVQIDDSCPATGFQSCSFPSPEASATGVVLTQWQPSTDLPVHTTPPVGTRYFWHVRACRGTQCSAWSQVRYLDVARTERDFNGDGYSDLAFGSPYSVPGTMPVTTLGRVYVYSGQSSLSTTATAIEQPDKTSGVSFGWELAAGDVNGDGFADLAVSNTYQTSAGYRYYIDIFDGSASGLPSTPSARIDETTPLVDIGRPMTMGDFDGDGYDDLVTGLDRSADFLHGFAGSASGLSATPTFSSPQWPGTNPPARFARPADANGDAIADLFTREGDTVVAWWGSLSPMSVWPKGGAASIALSSASMDTGCIQAGRDIDGDGLDDVVAGINVFSGNVGVAALALLSVQATTLTTRWSLRRHCRAGPPSAARSASTPTSTATAGRTSSSARSTPPGARARGSYTRVRSGRRRRPPPTSFRR
jgi:hypothetical protein